ncbi:MAG TPA: hypothetical protein VHX63_12415 [Acidobacteriaceae bacterium]|jgi:hypothetical protein|nr:hypothetical protein [Acidobacteriaceae bacterium]
MTLDEIVNDYIRTQRPYTGKEMMDFANEPSPSTAIRRAALCELKSGKRHDHQRRIPKWLLEQVETKLQAIRRRLSNAADFDALHRLVEEEIGGMKGIGALTVYDIAHRIGAYFRKAPERVYLHAGVRIGARARGIGGDYFDPKILPKPFARLAPSEIEDCLCIYKKQLMGGARDNSRRSSFCAVPRRPRC